MQGVSALLSVLGGELALYFAYKAARRDIWYWPPAHGIFVALFCRLVVKVAGKKTRSLRCSICTVVTTVALTLKPQIVDWSAIVHFRNPIDVGGLYFAFTMLLNILVGLASALSQTDSTMTALMAGACAGSATTFALLLLTIDKGYIRTFFDTRTGSSFIQDAWRDGEDDEQRFKIFTKNDKKWKEDIGIEVKAWLDNRFETWQEDAWFNEHKRSLVPDWIVDDGSLPEKIKVLR